MIRCSCLFAAFVKLKIDIDFANANPPDLFMFCVDAGVETLEQGGGDLFAFAAGAAAVRRCDGGIESVGHTADEDSSGISPELDGLVCGGNVGGSKV